MGANGPSLREGEGHRWLLFLSLSSPSLAPEETSAEEGMTRPSRGQCDSVHVIPPAVPVSISFVTSHSVDGEPRADSPTPAVTAVTTGVGEPCSGMKVLSLPLPLPLAHTSSQALVHLLLPFLWPGHPWPAGPWSSASHSHRAMGREPTSASHLFCLSCRRCLTSCQIPSLASL